MTQPYTKYQRSEIAKVFKRAQDHLWDGVSNTDELFVIHHICLAVRFTGVSKIAAFRARQIIMDRIFPHTTICQWLIYKAGVPHDEMTTERLQQYRLQWLKTLHKEFSTNN